MNTKRPITIPYDFLTTSPLTSLSELWHKDDDYPNCELCSKKFTFINRRHHCRNCGKVICDDCSMAQYTNANQNPYSPHKVCKLCKYCVFSQQGKESEECKNYMEEAKFVDDSLGVSDPEGGGKRARKTRKSRKVRKSRKSRKVRKSRKARKSRRRARR
jgi:hypothetical protein